MERKEAVGLTEAEKPGLDFSCYLIVKTHVELYICILSIFFIYVMSCSMFFFFLKSLRLTLLGKNQEYWWVIISKVNCKHIKIKCYNKWSNKEGQEKIKQFF